MPTVTDLPLLASGKVREMYGLGDRLLMVASDRISTYDVVHPTPIPDKGKVLTGVSAFWFARTGHIVANHYVSATDEVPDEVRGRAMAVRKLRMLPVECVVRGYITGSGWKDYQATGTMASFRTASARPRTSSGTASVADTKWLGQMCTVRSNQKCESPVRTVPLSGIGVGWTTS